MLNNYFDFKERTARIRSKMKDRDIDVLIGTRMKTISYISGTFVPYRAAVYIPVEGEISLYSSVIESERVKNETWLDDVENWVPIEGENWMDKITRKIKDDEFQNPTMGVEKGLSARITGGLITADEYEYLKQELSQAEIVNSSDIIDEVAMVKEPIEIKCLQESAKIADLGMKDALKVLEEGITETAVLGAGEKKMRELGSMWNWPVTGGDEIFSGLRGGISKCGCTPPTNKIIRKGEIVCIDLHPTYNLYYSDLACNVVMGEPTDEQQKLIDTFNEMVDFMFDNLSPGLKIGKYAETILEKLSETKYHDHVPPVFGHGIGIVGHDWYPPITVLEPWSEIEFRENMVEELYLQLNQPGVGGLRLELPVLITNNGPIRLTESPVRPLISLD